MNIARKLNQINHWKFKQAAHKIFEMAVYYKPVVEQAANHGSSPGFVVPFPAEVCSVDPKLVVSPASLDRKIKGELPIKLNIALPCARLHSKHDSNGEGLSFTSTMLTL